MSKRLPNRLLSLVLVLAICMGWMIPVSAADTTSVSLDFEQTETEAVQAKLGSSLAEEQDLTPPYAEDETVRVSIVLESEPTIDAGFSTAAIAQNAAAMAYRKGLKQEQETVTAAIEKHVLGGEALDVVWNLTLVGNIISANVEFGQIEDIANIPGVRAVELEAKYAPAVVDREEAADPMMATSGTMIGTNVAWAEGYTGAGMRIAVIDTGTDTDHQSFDAAAFQYSLAYQAGLSGMTVEEYIERLDLLDVEEIAGLMDQLHAAGEVEDITPLYEPVESAEDLYINSKLPFAYNYIDNNLKTDHDSDRQGSHGSHVAGIAAANAYVPSAGGGFAKALDTVFVQGVAPDAQIITMKVFGSLGGAYDSDYMIAVEDAIILGCDAINLSLGTSYPGFTRSAAYEDILESLENSDAVVAIAAGNAGHWAAGSYAMVNYLYSDDVNTDTIGMPGSYTNALTVASVDNDGSVGSYMTVGDETIFYTESTYKNLPLHTLAGEREYIYLDSIGSAEEFAAIKDVLKGKIAICNRGTISFFEKAVAAVENGAIATIIVNNVNEGIMMDLTSYPYTEPCVIIPILAGFTLKTAATAVTDDAGNILYYQGKLTVGNGMSAVNYDSDYYTMSSFSSWGVPGDLSMKPEITAPGGSIYSVNGMDPSGESYEVLSGTSMASPQVAGMAALVSQYIQDKGLAEKTGLSPRQLGQSLLMSTAVPMGDFFSGMCYYPVFRQGTGLANVGNAIAASSYIRMDDTATDSAADGKVKVELGDDPARTGQYTWSFTVNNMTDETQQYTLSTEMFTMALSELEGERWMDGLTTPLAADVVYTVNGETFVPTYPITADVDRDGDTDTDDALAALEYAMGARNADGLDLNVADQNGDGKVNTYDAHLLLSRAYTEAFAVSANGSVTVTVSVALTEKQKESLDASYVNGAYVQGYTFVEPVSTEEGALLDVTHSIPVLGFYGNWSDPSMFDKITAAEYVYDDKTVPYTGETWTNSLLIRYKNDNSAYYMVGNPYIKEETLHENRYAISSKTSIYQYRFSMIRNAAAVFVQITDENESLLYRSAVYRNINGAFYNYQNGNWYNTLQSVTLTQEPRFLGVEEGDKLNIQVYAVPEYYDVDGNMTDEDVDALLASGALGEGVCLSTTMIVDDTAPTMLGATKDLVSGDLTVTAQDNHYLAYIAVMNEFGARIYAESAPEITEEGGIGSYTFDLSEAPVGQYCTILLGDYAGNETTYKVHYGGEDTDYTNKMYAFTPGSTYHGEGNRWIEIDPDTLYFYYDRNTKTAEYGGIENVMYTELDKVNYAEYVDGYVFMLREDKDPETGAYTTTLYVAPHEMLSAYRQIAVYEGLLVQGMAYNYQNEKMYIIGVRSRSQMDEQTQYNDIYTVDLNTGELTKEYTVTLYRPGESHVDYPLTSYQAEQMVDMAIDDEGNFYTTNYGSGSGDYAAYLYTWRNEDVVDGAIAELPPVINPNTSNYQKLSPFACLLSSLSWDHDKDILYCAGIYGIPSSSNNILFTIDTETGVGTRTTVYDGGHGVAAAAQLRLPAYGLYIVPSFAERWAPATEATSIWMEDTELTLLQGSEYTMNIAVYPWSLEDNSVTWTTSDASVATVDRDGTVYCVAPGEAYITATSNVTPTVSNSCKITVKAAPTFELEAVVYDADGDPTWTRFNTGDLQERTVLHAADHDYLAAAMYEGRLIAHDGTNIYSLDPETHVSNLLGSVYGRTGADVATCVALGPDDRVPHGITTINADGNGLHVIEINSETEMGGFWNFGLSELDLGTDKLGALALIESWERPQTPTSTTMFVNGNTYYTLSEDGTLFKVTVFRLKQKMGGMGGIGGFPGGGEESWLYYNPTATIYAVGETGLDLGSVASNGSGHYCSMEYDTNSGLLILSSYYKDELNNIYLIDPVNMNYTKIGDLGRGIWPVVGLRLISDSTEEGENANGLSEAEKQFLALQENTVEGVYMNLDDLTEVNTTQAEGVVIDKENQTVTITMTSDNSTNGIHAIAYNASTLTFLRAESNAQLSVTKAETGKVTLGYANTFAGEAETTFTFSYTEGDVAVETLVELITTTQADQETVTSENITVVLPAFCDHNNIEVRYAVEATCTTAGHTGDTYCMDCGQLIEKGTLIESKGHSFGQWRITKPATCTDKGEETRSCAACDTAETRTIDATGHTFGQWTVTREATCEEAGIETRTCACGETEIRELPVTGHSFGQWKVTKEATCTEKGEETRTCVCGETETRAINAHGHDTQSVVIAPTCEQEGYTEHTCEVCGATWRDTIVSATGHDYEAVLTAPTCTEQGYTTYTCPCGETYTDDYTDALGHTFGEWVETKTPTCTGKGEEARVCSACDAAETREIVPYCPAENFTDVDTEQWYHEGVCYVLRNGLMNGKGDGKFAPTANLSRAEMVTVLYRMAGSPSVEGMNNLFTDVAADAWYADAVIWAANEEIVKGMTETTFAPTANITREQIATILYRYTGAEAVEEDALADFSDASAVSEWAEEAMNWAVSVGLINGMDSGTLAPRGNATRAQIATILMRYCEN